MRRACTPPPSPPPSLLLQVELDNTNSGAPLTGAGNAYAVSSSLHGAVAFAFDESDAVCGPGLQLVVQLALTLWVSPTTSVGFNVSLWTYDVAAQRPLAMVAASTGNKVVPASPSNVNRVTMPSSATTFVCDTSQGL